MQSLRQAKLKLQQLEKTAPALLSVWTFYSYTITDGEGFSLGGGTYFSGEDSSKSSTSINAYRAVKTSQFVRATTNAVSIYLTFMPE